MVKEGSLAPEICLAAVEGVMPVYLSGGFLIRGGGQRASAACTWRADARMGTTEAGSRTAGDPLPARRPPFLGFMPIFLLLILAALLVEALALLCAPEVDFLAGLGLGDPEGVDFEGIGRFGGAGNVTSVAWNITDLP